MLIPGILMKADLPFWGILYCLVGVARLMFYITRQKAEFGTGNNTKPAHLRHHRTTETPPALTMKVRTRGRRERKRSLFGTTYEKDLCVFSRTQMYPHRLHHAGSIRGGSNVKHIGPHDRTIVSLVGFLPVHWHDGYIVQVRWLTVQREWGTSGT